MIQIPEQLILFLKESLDAVVKPVAEKARAAANEMLIDGADAVIDTAREIAAGRMSVEEWAKVFEKTIDNIKERFVEEGNLKYIGGKLRFKPSSSKKYNVNASFQLYFMDVNEEWHKAEADTDISNNLFTRNSLNELRSDGEIIFDVE